MQNKKIKKKYSRQLNLTFEYLVTEDEVIIPFLKNI